MSPYRLLRWSKCLGLERNYSVHLIAVHWINLWRSPGWRAVCWLQVCRGDRLCIPVSQQAGIAPQLPAEGLGDGQRNTGSPGRNAGRIMSLGI